jgi:site-specific recombinase XerD
MPPHGWLFPGRSHGDPISPRQINRAMHEAVEAAGIKKRVSPHTLRHNSECRIIPRSLRRNLILIHHQQVMAGTR